MTDPTSSIDSSETRTPLQVWIPEGYASLPLENISESLRRTEPAISDFADHNQQTQAQLIIGTIGAFLQELVTTGAIYCGIGRHTSAGDGTVVTSTLVVSHHEYEGKRNPRLLLGDLLHANTEPGEDVGSDLVDVLGSPVLFFERVRSMPSPQFLENTEYHESADSLVFQLEAHVPSEDGSEVALVELSTPFVPHGPKFRSMVVRMAASVSFKPPEQTESSSRIQRLLG